MTKKKNKKFKNFLRYSQRVDNPNTNWRVFNLFSFSNKSTIMQALEVYMKNFIVTNANEAVAKICYNFIDVACVYPITPSTEMAEFVDKLSFKDEKNFFGQKVLVREMQSEAGSIAMMHGALTSGALAATFTCSQGLLLMIPEMYRISAAHLPGVIHVASRAIARHALSILGDHSDVYACRQTGWAMLCSSSVQEALDFAAIAHLTAIDSSFPILHFFDGFRTSHEIQKIRIINNSYLKNILNYNQVQNFRNSSLSPSRNFIRGSNQNDDIFFQCCEANNIFEQKIFENICKYMDIFNNNFSENYHPFDFYGAPDAEYIIIAMGSVCLSIEEAVDYLNKTQNRKVGLIKVRLFRPFNSDYFCNIIPKSVKKISVIDKSKELGATGEPLFLDILPSVNNLNLNIQVLHGRYGLGGKNTSFKDILSVFENMFQKNSKKNFTVGINDDITNLSLNNFNNKFSKIQEINSATECKFFGLGTDGIIGAVKNSQVTLSPATPERSVTECKFFGPGSDGTIGAVKSPQVTLSPAAPERNVTECKFFGIGSDGMIGAVKNITEIIGENTDFNVQFYPQYDSKKSGGLTISHLRFSKEKIKSEYYIEKADYLICSNPEYVFKYDFTKNLKKNSIFLINSQDNIKIPKKLYDYIKINNIIIYVIDAKKIAEDLNLKSFYGIIMQGAFFKICLNLNFYKQKDFLKLIIKDFYYKKDPKLINSNINAFDIAFETVKKIDLCEKNIAENPEFEINMNDLPVSEILKFANGNTPAGSSLKNKFNSKKIPNWVPENCIQCGLCSLICPHGCIRTYIFEKNNYNNFFKTEKLDQENSIRQRQREYLLPTSKEVYFKNNENSNLNLKFANLFGDSKFNFSIYINSDYCTGCTLCSKICPGLKNKKALEIIENKKNNSNNNCENTFFEKIEIPDEIKNKFLINTVKGSQLREPLMRFSSACPGCGEMAYAKLVTQLFGERLVISNATGCSSIWGGSFYDVPYFKSKKNFLPAWQNSLFENAAEFGIGMLDAHKAIRNQILENIQELLTQKIKSELKNICLEYIQTFNSGEKNFEISQKLIKILENQDFSNKITEKILSKKEYLSKKSFWIFGGDGWAYDIGFGGLDHIIASGENINILVFDTEIYSNTGGQASKSTPKHAVAPFELAGKNKNKKSLAKMMMLYENVYIAQVSIGANPNQCVKVFCEAENYNGPALIIAYSPCIGHKIKGGLQNSLETQKLAVNSGYFDLFRYNPENKNLIYDSKSDKNLESKFFEQEKRFKQN